MAGVDNLSDVVYEETFKGARKMGVSQAVSADLARLVDETIKRRFGGERVYVPAPGKEERDKRIFRALERGVPVSVVARNEKLSVRWIYKIRVEFERLTGQRVGRL